MDPVGKIAERHGLDTAQINVAVGIFESYTLFLAALGTLEFGYFYTCIFCFLITTVAFSEMVKLERIKDKEASIVFKSKFINWYFFFTFQFIAAPYTWLTLPLVQASGIATEPNSYI